MMFAAVVINYRYVFAFGVLAWTGMFVAGSAVLKTRKAAIVFLAVAATLILLNGKALARPAVKMALGVIRPSKPTYEAAVAEHLRVLGIRDGDELCIAGNFFLGNGYYWARLAPARVTLAGEGLVGMSDTEAQRTVEALRANGARAIISMGRPAFQAELGWVRVPDSNFYLLLLDSGPGGRSDTSSPSIPSTS
jgi:hypothetical protein